MRQGKMNRVVIEGDDFFLIPAALFFISIAGKLPKQKNMDLLWLYIDLDFVTKPRLSLI
jgi:hypothetical protein